MAFYDVELGPLQFVTVMTDSAKEQLGSGLTVDGPAIGPGDPKPAPFPLELPVYAQPGEDRTVAERLRRQVRALLSNAPLLNGGLWFSFSQDHELDCWLLIGGGTIEEADGGATMADWKVSLTDCYRIGSPRTHRPARELAVADRRLATTPRDTLGTVFSDDFAAAPATVALWLPSGVSDVHREAGAEVTGTTVTTGDGGTLTMLTGLDAYDTVSFEQPDGGPDDRGSVRAYDRRGSLTAPDTAPAAAWEQITGPDWPLLTADVPVIENGLARVRIDGTDPLWIALDAWDAGAWQRQAWVAVKRGGVQLDVLHSASCVEWTPERVVIQIIGAVSSASASRTIVYLTLGRGWPGPRIEVYTGASVAAEVDAILTATTVTADHGANWWRLTPDSGLEGIVATVQDGVGSSSEATLTVAATAYVSGWFGFAASFDALPVGEMMLMDCRQRPQLVRR